MLTNQVNYETVNFLQNNSTLVRVWAAQAYSSDKQLFNVEYTPYVKLEVHHEFDLLN